jgi:putative oxidoreductase
MSSRRWILGAGGGTVATDAGLAILRVGSMVLLILLHGLRKLPPAEGFVGRIGRMGFPAPEVFAWLAALAETGAPLLIALGLLTRPAALYVALHFVVVVFVAHAGDTLAERELAVMFGMIALVLALTGPGRYSLDAAIGRPGGAEVSSDPAARRPGRR